MVSCLHCLIIIFCVRFDASNGYENLALNKSAWQPTTYGAPGWTAFAAAAVDGNRDQFAPHSSCAMQAGATTAEWNVDLGKVHDIDYIDVYFRHDSPSLWNSQYKNRIAGFQIYVSNTTERVDRGLCFTEAGSIKPIMTIQCVQRGKYVIFYNTQNFKLYNELCEVEVYACPPERFGLKCNETCSNCYTNTSTMCDHVKGKCHSGCNSGWKGDRCTEECDSHFYGPNCHLKCGNCLNNIPCHHVNGTCPSGCAAGWKGNKCFDECDNLFYGLRCEMPCGHCFNKTQCHHVNGSCTNGCGPGYQNHDCKAKCDDFKYGPQCSMICGNCLNNIKCHHINGTCPDGCQPGWQNHNCKSKCDDFKYGPQCSMVCGNCLNKTKCHHINGTCPGGCQPGWQNHNCKSKCDDFKYGPECSMVCGSCLDNIKCDHINGTCPDGCQPGWQNHNCKSKCDDFKYGPHCSMVCGNCLNKTKCHHINGTCTDGCHPGWQNHNCKSIERESPVQNHYTAMKSCETVLLGAIIGWIFNAIFIVCGLILIVLFKTRKLGLVKKRSTLYEDIQMKNPNDNHIYSATKSN